MEYYYTAEVVMQRLYSLSSAESCKHFGSCPLIHPVLSSRVSRIGRVSRVSRVSRVRVTAYCYH